jgi:hypothetical protein
LRKHDSLEIGGFVDRPRKVCLNHDFRNITNGQFERYTNCIPDEAWLFDSDVPIHGPVLSRKIDYRRSEEKGKGIEIKYGNTANADIVSKQRKERDYAVQSQAKTPNNKPICRTDILPAIKDRPACKPGKCTQKIPLRFQERQSLRS